MAYADDRAHFWASNADRLRAHGLQPLRANLQPIQPQAQQQQHFDWYAQNARQHYSHLGQQPFWQAADRIVFAPWRAEIRPGQWLLDVGCAQGRSTYKMMDLEINVMGFDISKRLIRQDIERYRQGPWKVRATFFVADASSIPLVSECVDCALCYGVLHHLPSVDQACKEIAQVLKPSGVYWGQENNATIFRGMFDFLQRFNLLWHEQAGPGALISQQRLQKAFANTGVKINTTTSVFRPPHVINLLSGEIGHKQLDITDLIAWAIPILRHNGGILVIRGIKGET